MVKYTDAFIPAIIGVSSKSKIKFLNPSFGMELKKHALYCLIKAIDLPTHLLTKYNKQVTNNLKLLRDDKKRIIRRFATKCINDWSALP
jgi:hypothetical protein